MSYRDDDYIDDESLYHVGDIYKVKYKETPYSNVIVYNLEVGMMIKFRCGITGRIISMNGAPCGQHAIILYKENGYDNILFFDYKEPNSNFDRWGIVKVYWEDFGKS